MRAFRSIADLPGAPDATFIGVNRNLTIDMLRALRERGAGGRDLLRRRFSRDRRTTTPMARGCRTR